MEILRRFNPLEFKRNLRAMNSELIAQFAADGETRTKPRDSFTHLGNNQVVVKGNVKWKYPGKQPCRKIDALRFHHDGQPFP